MSGLDPTDFQPAAEFIADWRRPLLLTHAKADCDALGALIAMRSILGAQGKDVLAVPFDRTPARYVALHQYAPMPVWSEDLQESDLVGVDGVIIMDTCTYNQLAPLAEWLRGSSLPKLVVDHHLTRDELADHYLIDGSASAVCLVLYEWAKAMGWAMDSEARHALFIGMATDTGWFRHDNTDQRTLAAASELVGAGVNAGGVYRHLYQTDTAARLRLLGELLHGMELCFADRLAVLFIPAGAFERLGGRMSDSEDMINEPLRIASVEVSVLLVEQDDGIVRVSLRSKPPDDSTTKDVDVAAVAQELGGGGHKRASGARVRGALDEVRQMVIDRIKPLLG